MTLIEFYDKVVERFDEKYRPYLRYYIYNGRINIIFEYEDVGSSYVSVSEQILYVRDIDDYIVYVAETMIIRYALERFGNKNVEPYEKTVIDYREKIC